MDATVLLFDRFTTATFKAHYTFRLGIDHALQETSIDPHNYNAAENAIEQDVRHPRIIEQVKSWLRTCVEEHAQCRGQEPTTLHRPRRLLDLRDGSIKLVESSQTGLKTSWMTLSYCWGSDQEVKLTKHSLLRHQIGIEHSSLPNTIRDAIDVARALDIWYLWVDLLCIIQDDGGEDWNLHAGLMHHIYGNAKLTLCACSAMSATEGFRSSEGLYSQGRRVAQRYRYAQRHQAGLADLLPVIAAYPLAAVRNRSPTNKRGWIFQEEMLSSRTLYWSDHGVYWSCHAKVVGENNTTSELPRITAGPNENGINTSADEREILDRHDFNLSLRETDWERMIEAYSTREFTRMTDRLPALRGLAAVWRESQRGQYIETAGMWKN